MIVQMLFAIFAVLTIEEFEIRITLMMRYWMFLVVVRRRLGDYNDWSGNLYKFDLKVIPFYDVGSF
jgi:hypothetical protein